ncbi:MAG TPA: YfhO family protein [Acidimicrobiales bacterium]|nr:YfhO family protein [Acidimicrobiales bacterium]
MTEEPAEQIEPDASGWRRWRGDVLGVGAVVVFVLSYLSPALKDGGSLGGYDTVIPLTSLGSGLYAALPHNALNSDSVSQMAAWNAYNWLAIHHLQFPLWNDLTLLGVPHFFNFESATLSLPDLVSYLVPLRYAFLVAVAVKLLIAGTGVYVLCRVLGLQPLSSSFGGVIFMLSGAYASWLSWPLSDVLAWLAWLAALAILAYRWQGRRRYVALLAGATAFSIYGGFPEANVFAVITLGLLLGVSLLGAWVRHQKLSLAGLARIVAGAVAGIALAAPLWLPGLQVVGLAHRQTETGFPGDPASALSLLVAPGYFGLPIKGSSWFLAGFNYYETAVYVGVIALVLAGVAMIRWWRIPMVLALAAAAVVAVALSYQTHSFHIVQDLLNHQGLSSIEWLRMRTVLGLPIGVLAALGLETMLKARGERHSLVAYWICVALLVVVVAVLWYRAAAGIASATLLRLRHDSLIWPLGLVAACVVAGALFTAAARNRQRVPGRRLGWCGAALLAGAEGAFLLFSGVGINSYSHSFYPETPAIARLQATVGNELVGLDTGSPAQDQQFQAVGFFPEVNLGYDVNEYGGHDPLIPEAYFRTWAPGGSDNGGPGLFLPDVDSAATARRYGIAWILEAPELPGSPVGARYVATLAGERLYAVPGASRFSFVGAAATQDRVTTTTHPVASSWTIRVNAEVRGKLVLRVTDVPGWHATIDGHAVALGTPDGLMMQVSVAPGTHTIVLWYLPSRFVEGLVVALAVLLGLLAAAVLPLVRRRRIEPSAIALDVGFGKALATLEAGRGQAR